VVALSRRPHPASTPAPDPATPRLHAHDVADMPLAASVTRVRVDPGPGSAIGDDPLPDRLRTLPRGETRLRRPVRLQAHRPAARHPPHPGRACASAPSSPAPPRR
jgi:hypothetical protein